MRAKHRTQSIGYEYNKEACAAAQCQSVMSNASEGGKIGITADRSL